MAGYCRPRTGIIQKLADDGVQPVDFIDDYFQKLLLLFQKLRLEGIVLAPLIEPSGLRISWAGDRCHFREHQ